MYQNVTVGGQTSDGKDAVNKLFFLVLKSVGQTRLPQPNLTVRYHRNLNQAFMDEAIEVLKLGTGMPAFNNDEVIILWGPVSWSWLRCARSWRSCSAGSWVWLPPTPLRPLRISGTDT